MVNRRWDLSVKRRLRSGKHLTPILIAVLILLSYSLALMPEVAGDVTAERSFLSPSADGYAVATGDDFLTPWSALTGSLDTSSSAIVGGMWFDGDEADYWIWRSFVYFDTSALPDGANITSAELSVYIMADNSDEDFNFTIQGTGTYPHYPPQAGDYWSGWYGSTSLGSRDTGDGLSESAYWNITLNSAGRALISTNGTTRFCLRSSEDIDGTEPLASGEYFLELASRDDGESTAPKLYVSYTVSGEGGGGSSGTFKYYFNGPYEDDGTVYNGTVTCKIYPSYNSSISFDLVGDGATADSANYEFEQQAVLVLWNISDTGNYSRVIYFTSDDTETVYVMVPDSALPFYLYSFTVNDFEGVTNGFLESLSWVDGANRVVERQPIATINAAPYYMTWSHAYPMRVVCDEGTLDLGTFTALTVTDQIVVIPYGAFPSDSSSLTVEVNAVRLNSTAIYVTYLDEDDLTYWLAVSIKHRARGNSTYATDYSTNTTSASSYSLTWASANNATDYLVYIQGYRNGEVKNWTFSLIVYRSYPNMWAPLANLGNFEGTDMTLEYVPAIALIVGSLLAFSFWHISAGAWIAWGMAGLTTWLGWLPYDSVASPVGLGLAAVVCAGITIGEFKKTERDI